MMYEGNNLVIINDQRQREIIHNVYQGLDDNAKAVALSSLLGRTSTYQKITNSFYLYTILRDVAEHIKSCAKCQRHLAMVNNVKQELTNIPVPLNVMKQISVDPCSLPKIYEFKHVVVWFCSQVQKQNPLVTNLPQQLHISCMKLTVNVDVLLYR